MFLKFSLPLVFLFAAVGFSTRAHAQTRDTALYEKVDVQPAFPGGSEAFGRYIQRKLRYPLEARKNEIQGTVIVQFIVDTDGTVSNVQALYGPTMGGLREEAVRLVAKSGKWVPGIQYGHPARCPVKQPIVFVLQRE